MEDAVSLTACALCPRALEEFRLLVFPGISPENQQVDERLEMSKIYGSRLEADKGRSRKYAGRPGKRGEKTWQRRVTEPSATWALS